MVAGNLIKKEFAELSAELSWLLQKTSECGFAIVVEGGKDKSALEKLGAESSKIFVLSKKPLFEVAESIATNYKTAAILTDLDSEGKKLYGKLNTLLRQNGVGVDNSLRNFLFRSTRLRQIEGISNFFP